MAADEPAPPAGPLLPAGVGIGWRPEISGLVADLPGLAFCEVIAETLASAVPPRGVVELRGRGVPVVPHGVRLALGGSAPVDAGRVTHLAACAAALGAPLVSEHIAFVRAGGRDAGHLLPVPRTREALDVLTANVRRTRAELDVPLALEPIAALFDWPDDEYTEADFLAELLERTGALLLLDVANLYANAVNRGQDPDAVLDRYPLDRVAYVHVAGGGEHPGDPGLYHDTHTDPVPPAVLRLLDRLVDLPGGPPPVMLERDGRYPPAAELRGELAAVAAASHQPPPTTPASRPICAGESPGSGGRVAPTPPASRPLSAGESPDPGPRLAPAGAATSGPHGTDLPARQAELVAALVAGGPAPAGFDPERLGPTRRALLRKRAGEAATVWPLVAASLGARWPDAFTAHHAGREPAGALRDGWDVARALRRRGELGAYAAVELAEREAALRYDGATVPRPRPRARIRRAVARLLGGRRGRRPHAHPVTSRALRAHL